MPDNDIQQAIEFLSAFFPDSEEGIHFRAFKPKAEPKTKETFAVKEVYSIKQLREGSGPMARLSHLNEQKGIYFVVNAGGNKAESITRFNAFFMEIDGRPISEQHRVIDDAPIKPNIRVETQNSVHSYWLIKDECSREEWSEVQRRLIAHFDSDIRIKDPSRVMRVPGFHYVEYDTKEERHSHPKLVRTVEFDIADRVTAQQMLIAFPHLSTAGAITPHTRATDLGSTSGRLLKFPVPTYDDRFTTFEQRAEELARRILREPSASINASGKVDCRGICHEGTGSTALMYDPATQKVHCNNGCSYKKILRAFGLPDCYLPPKSANSDDNGLPSSNSHIREKIEAIIRSPLNYNRLVRASHNT